MRRAYSAHSACAQSGSLALAARTCSLGTRVRLFRRLLRLGHLHGLAAPDFLQVVEAAHRGMHDVHDDVSQVHQHPLAARLALDAIDARAERLDPLLDALGERVELAARVAA